MKLERSNVEFAIWRKKVDKSLLEHSGTIVPDWACRMWGLKQLYGACHEPKGFQIKGFGHVQRCYLRCLRHHSPPWTTQPCFSDVV